MKPRRKTSRPRSRRSPSEKEYELEVLEGLEEFALAEARRVLDSSATSCRVTSPGRISLRTTPRPSYPARTQDSRGCPSSRKVPGLPTPRTTWPPEHDAGAVSRQAGTRRKSREAVRDLPPECGGKRLRSHDPNQGPDLQRSRPGGDRRACAPSDNCEEVR